MQNFWQIGPAQDRPQPEVHSLLVVGHGDPPEEVHRQEVVELVRPIQRHWNPVQRGNSLQRSHSQVCLRHPVEDERSSAQTAVHAKKWLRRLDLNLCLLKCWKKNLKSENKLCWDFKLVLIETLSHC